MNFKTIGASFVAGLLGASIVVGGVSLLQDDKVIDLSSTPGHVQIITPDGVMDVNVSQSDIDNQNEIIEATPEAVSAGVSLLKDAFK